MEAASEGIQEPFCVSDRRTGSDRAGDYPSEATHETGHLIDPSGELICTNTESHAGETIVSCYHGEVSCCNSKHIVSMVDP